MHTDEYEISVGREISLGRKLIRGLKRSIQKKERQHGISTEVLLEALCQGQLAETNTDFSNWRRDWQELQGLERMPSQ
jgi:hypothetical protein